MRTDCVMAAIALPKEGRTRSDRLKYERIKLGSVSSFPVQEMSSAPGVKSAPCFAYFSYVFLSAGSLRPRPFSSTVFHILHDSIDIVTAVLNREHRRVPMVAEIVMAE